MEQDKGLKPGREGNARPRKVLLDKERRVILFKVAWSNDASIKNRLATAPTISDLAVEEVY